MLRRIVALAITLLAAATAARAQTTAPDPPQIPLWPAGAPGALGTAPVDVPSIAVYAPGHPDGSAIVICPGGGYTALAGYEGRDPALWLRDLGITAIVLTYRLGPRYHYPAQFLDAARAVRYTRTPSRGTSTLRASASWGSPLAVISPRHWQPTSTPATRKQLTRSTASRRDRRSWCWPIR